MDVTMDYELSDSSRGKPDIEQSPDAMEIDADEPSQAMDTEHQEAISQSLPSKSSAQIIEDHGLQFFEPPSPSQPSQPLEDAEPQISMQSRLSSALTHPKQDKEPLENNLPYLLATELFRIVSRSSVKQLLLSLHNCAEDEVPEIVDYVCGPDESTLGTETKVARRVFAILVLCVRASSIVNFKRENICDADLPVSIQQIISATRVELRVLKRCGSPISNSCFESWHPGEIKNFEAEQWSVHVPFFSEDKSKPDPPLPIYHLYTNSRLPWDVVHAVKDSGQSQVWQIEINTNHHRLGCEPITSENMVVLGERSPKYQKLEMHPSQHGFISHSNTFALKKPNSAKVYDLELKALMKIRNLRNAHLASLLLAFEGRNRCSIIPSFLFRWADGGNLATLWNNHMPVPDLNVKNKWVIWIAEQCAGLASGLKSIHCAKLPIEELRHAIDNTQSRGSKDDKKADNKKADDNKADSDGDYGRHGDIKPENILWFRHDDNQYGHGVLKIADFGLASFHQKQTTMQQKPGGVAVTNTYMDPEYMKDKKVNRKFDVWSLGCVYLEFATWAIFGATGVTNFRRERMYEADVPQRGALIRQDTFYASYVDGENNECRRIKRAVTKQYSQCRQSDKCCGFLDEFLDLIKRLALVIRRGKRGTSDNLSQELEQMHNMCKADSRYCSEKLSDEVKGIRSRNGPATKASGMTEVTRRSARLAEKNAKRDILKRDSLKAIAGPRKIKKPTQKRNSVRKDDLDTTRSVPRRMTLRSQA